MSAGTAEVIQNRYVLEDVLGVGGMGVVFKAYDRLDDSVVALKRINVPVNDLQAAADAEHRKMVLYALTQEFQILASLRHPNIIRVLDYGFDAERNPFLTMDYLPEARDLMLASLHESTQTRVQWLIDVLQALAYLHQRDVLHRDLKPGNVLVSEDKIHLLDFGLSVERERAEGRAGTMAYMAPEVIRQGQVTEAADLYSLGTMAYELFAGDLPFEPMDVMGIVASPPDMSKVLAPEDVAMVIERLLLKSPEDRYASAEETIKAFCYALDMPLPSEDASIRESYLQAAKFVGRSDELQRLTSALNSTKLGRGSIWLIGGESGVGKSRLLNELRTQALLKGTHVVRGQAAQTSIPFEMWRNPIRWMLLSTEMSDVDAGIVKEIIPDVERLLKREIPAIPALEGNAHQQRLLLTLLEMLKRQTEPMLILLEDLQWADESIDLLKRFQEEIGNYPLCIVCSYRSEERPELPDEIPLGVQIPLNRLERDEITKLSESMIGEVAAPVVDLLEQETEGNAYFLVEVIRALAEEAGSLHKIGLRTLPTNVFSGGVAAVLRRRLSKIPEAMQHITHLAAIFGRRVDVPLLDNLEARATVDKWLTVAANAAVLDVQDGYWRFAHDKLREMVLEDLSPVERKILHQRAAEAIEDVYPHDEDYIGQLANHWHEAGNAHRAAFYGLKQAERLLLLGQTRSLIDLCLQLLATDAVGNEYRAPLLRILGDAYQRKANYARAKDQYSDALALADKIKDADTAVYAIKGLATLNFYAGEIEAAEVRLKEALPYEAQVKDTGSIAHIINNLGVIARARKDFPTADTLFLKALELHKTGNSPYGLATTMFNVADSINRQGNHEQAIKYFNEIIETALSIGNLTSAASAYAELGTIHLQSKAYEQALAAFQKELDLQQRMENTFSIALNHLNTAFTHEALQNNELARQALNNAVKLLRHSEFVILQLLAVVCFARLLLAENRGVRAAELLGFVTRHERGSYHEIQPYIQDLQANVKKKVPPFLLNMAKEADSAPSLDSILAELAEFTAHHLDEH